VSSARAAEAPVLVLERVGRRFGATTVLSPLTLRLAAGAVCLVSGDNGAGKTTLLRIAAGLLQPTVGSRSATGAALYLRPGSAVRRRQRVLDAVVFAAALAERDDPARVAASALDACGFPADLRLAEVGRLSAGQRARVTLGVARAAAPALVCLDEPLEHLDPAGRHAVTDTVEGLAGQGTAVLVATAHADGDVGPVDAHLRLRAGLPAVFG
jgi:ABC-type multidrug transport system ATPase subunit